MLQSAVQLLGAWSGRRLSLNIVDGDPLQGGEHVATAPMTTSPGRDLMRDADTSKSAIQCFGIEGRLWGLDQGLVRARIPARKAAWDA